MIHYECGRIIKSKKGQTAVEYVVTAAGLFTVLISFYILYSNLVPKQFDQGAKVILTVYETD